MRTKTEQLLINYYLEYVNDYLTVAKFAEHNGLNEHEAFILISLGKEIHERPNPDSQLKSGKNLIKEHEIHFHVFLLLSTANNAIFNYI